MRFEFDPRKSETNKEKHGIDFVEAQRLWEDVRRVEVPARTRGEVRFATIAALDGETWVAIWTWRDDAVRLISARRAREGERQIYETQNDEV